MSIVFVVGSDDQLRSGTPWCKRFAEATETAIHVIVVGTDRKVLLKHTQVTLSEQLDTPVDKLSITVVEEEADAVLDAVKTLGGKNLLMLRSADGDAMQQAVFEKSPIVTVWLRAAEGPPVEREHVICALGETQRIATSTAENLLQLIPSALLVPEPIATDESVHDHVTCAVESVTGGDHNEHDLICVGVVDPVKDNAAYLFGKQLIESATTASVALISDGDSIQQLLSRTFADRIKRWVASVAPPMEREERLMLVDNLEQGSKPNLEFLGLISASAMLAAFGLLQDSAAVIIGAMLIAPLMTPILGAGLSLTHGNRPLFKSSLLTILLGFVGALSASILFGWLVILVRPGASDHLDWITPEMWSRCRPSPLDFCVGLVGGIAAAYAQTRKHLSSALAGAAIAAALVPPLSTAGLQIAFGIWGDLESKDVPAGVLPVIGPMLLVTVNVLTIMIGASFVLWARGMRSDQKTSVKAKWVPRVIALLLILTALILVSVVGPEIIFPSDG